MDKEKWHSWVCGERTTEQAALTPPLNRVSFLAESKPWRYLSGSSWRSSDWAGCCSAPPSSRGLLPDWWEQGRQSLHSAVQSRPHILLQTLLTYNLQIPVETWDVEHCGWEREQLPRTLSNSLKDVSLFYSSNVQLYDDHSQSKEAMKGNVRKKD